MKLFIILFKAADGSDQEGIYAMSVDNRNIVVAFAAEDDAQRFATLLEAQDFFSPLVEEIDSEELEAFCEEADYTLAVVPEGELAIPPETNLDQMDWDPSALSEDEDGEDEDLEAEEVAPLSAEMEAFRRRLEKLL